MRYSAATCNPNAFNDSGFTLRQVHYDPLRRTELLCRTMHGVIKNVAHLCKRDRSKMWGKDGWKKVVVCVYRERWEGQDQFEDASCDCGDGRVSGGGRK